jgi:hypothetical protein
MPPRATKQTRLQAAKQALNRGHRAQLAIKWLLEQQQANIAKRITVLKGLIANQDATILAAQKKLEDAEIEDDLLKRMNDVKCLCNDNYKDLEARCELYKADVATIEAEEEAAPFPH